MDPVGTPCTLCNGVVPGPLSEAVGDKLAIFQAVTSKKNVLSMDIAPEDWTDEIHSSFVKSLWEDCKDVDITCEEDLEDALYDRVFAIVYANFWEEYGDLLKEVDVCKSVHAWYAKRVKLGSKGFHKWIGRELRFKSFCARFYETLRERSNVTELEMREEFAELCANKWTFEQYARELTKKQKT